MPENFENSEEKRRHPRAESHLPVEYKNLKRLKETPIEVLSKDISEGGVRFKSEEFISLACRLLLEISIPTHDKPIRAITKVAWIRKSPDKKEYEIGNQFLEISKEDKANIANFVNHLITTSL